MSEFGRGDAYPRIVQRYEAFWHREIVDRPLLALTITPEGMRPDPEPVNMAWLPDSAPALLRRSYASHRERWLDTDTRVERLAWELSQSAYVGDALPIAVPNLGPEIFSAWCGCGYEYGKTTTWSTPAISDWDSSAGDGEPGQFDPSHELFRALDSFTRALIERSSGSFIVGLTDFHSGGDHLAALRDPAELAIDLIDHPDEVKAVLARSAREYVGAYDHFYGLLRDAGMPITTWLSLIHEGRYYVPSNDFSAMISTPMFEEFFLPGIANECRFLDRSIYHLDGPAALRHLDALLEIRELDAVQWVPGAGNTGFARWVPVYKRIQAAGKGMQILDLTLDDLPLLFEELRPNGVFISGISGVTDIETAERVLEAFARWR